uniref:Salivary lipocalin n=1 Tax=Triatoma dimidiata TaxID=72491 RepID=D1MWA9_TRIDM|nr:hypothetical protein Td03 similar to procalin precursor [Triatoma dimidiata]
MKTFIALTFIGILTYAYAGFVEKCTTPTTVMDNFSAPKYHQGTWYVTHVKESPNDCQILSTSQDGDKSIVEHAFTHNGTPGKQHCEALPKKEKRLTFTCMFGDESIDTTVQIVMATDYDNYSLYYLCSTFTSGPDTGKTVDNYLLASRQGITAKIPKELESLTRGLKLQKCNYS